ncbi:MAG TPA: DUF177 domain-containing protein [Polyangia bacterium]|jgi:uncharacterized metal-binding protein YceD (DUF177 family)|nr:DUF177 domain-containing protein [Polyangia bacterium]
MMRIKIKDIPDSGRALDITFDRAFLGDALEGFDADLQKSQAFASLFLNRMGDQVFARGQLGGTLTIPCARCLVPTSLRVDVPLRVTFIPEDELPPEDRVTDDVEFATHDRQYVVLDNILREALILAIPMTPLCRESCQGLCPICGQDRNEGDCGCMPESPDPRFAALKDLKL